MMMNYDENNANNAADDNDNNDGDDAIKMHMFYFIVAPWLHTMPEILTNISSVRYHVLIQSWIIFNRILRNSFREMWFKMQ